MVDLNKDGVFNLREELFLSGSVALVNGKEFKFTVNG